MVEQRDAAAEPTPVRAPQAPPPVTSGPRMPAAFASALAGAALLVGTVIVIVIVVQASAG